MDLLMLAERENVLLGREFLTWLWYASDTRGSNFKAADGTAYTLHMEKKISVQGGEGENLETATVSGPGAELTEARAGLLAGKKVDKALVVIEVDADGWQLQLSSKDFGISGMKTPKIDDKPDEDEDTDGIFLEKMYLIDRPLVLVDELYAEFLKLRLSMDWNAEVAGMKAWLGAG